MASKELTEKCIESDTFKPTGEHLGYGCWGSVDVYTDRGGIEWAVKIFDPDEIAKAQMSKRGWTEESVMRNEAIPLDAAHNNVVPRLIERDKKGRMYVAMPVYREGNLSEKIGYRGYKPEMQNEGARLKEILSVTKDVAKALGYLHDKEIEIGNNGSAQRKRRVHGDVKPANILFQEKNAYLTDLGSSTCISVSDEKGRTRGEFGDRNYRAPEAFNDNSEASPKTDIFSAGATLYEMITGDGIYEGSVNLHEKEEKEFNGFINKKLKKVPRGVRGLLRKCIALNPHDRYYDGRELRRELESVIENLNHTNRR